MFQSRRGLWVGMSLEALFLDDSPALDAERAKSTACLVHVTMGPRRADVPVPPGRWATHTLGDVLRSVQQLWYIGDAVFVDAAGSRWTEEEFTRNYLLCQLVDGRGPLEVVPTGEGNPFASTAITERTCRQPAPSLQTPRLPAEQDSV